MWAGLRPRHPEGRLFTIDELQSARALRGETVVDETIAISLPDGRKVIISNAAAPMRTGEEITGAVGVWRDITERYDLQARIAHERSLLEAVLRQIPAAIVIAEAPSGKVILTNERVLEYLLEPLRVMEVADYGQYEGTHLDGRPLAAEDWPIVRAIQHGDTIINELITVTRKDGSRIVLSMSAAPVHDTNRNIVAGVAAMYEVDPTMFTPKY